MTSNTSYQYLRVFLFLGLGLTLKQLALSETKAKEPFSQEEVSYVLGYNIGESIQRNGIQVKTKILMEAIQDALSKKPNRYQQSEVIAVMQYIDQSTRKKREEEYKRMSEINLKAAGEFLAQNKTKKGIKQTKSGLQYEELKPGEGKSPKATDKVKVHYAGKLLDGSEFDSSYKRNSPAQFALNQVIPGWTEGLQLMKPKAKYRFYIPPGLAYGANPPPNSRIPPNSLLIFEVELIEVLP